MPGWSPDIANEFIRRGLREGRAFDQMQLQKLVYIAHGWCLAFSGEPLTGDRPEAWDFGPVYRRLANALQRRDTTSYRRDRDRLVHFGPSSLELAAFRSSGSKCVRNGYNFNGL